MNLHQNDDEVTDNANDMDALNRNVPDQACQTHRVLQSTPLDLIETGKTLKVQAERPHLVSLGSGRLSTAITLLPLPEGKTTLGHGNTDINIQGPGVSSIHCYIENQTGDITLFPCGNLCSVDGLAVTKPVRLSQGCMLCFGQSAFFRFNHPEEALRMKNLMPDGNSVHINNYKRVSEFHGMLNGNNHLITNERACLDQSTMTRSFEMDFQDIMNSLTMNDSQASAPGIGKPTETSIPQSPHSHMVNGDERYLLSSLLSPGAMSVGSSYENNTPFSPNSSSLIASSTSMRMDPGNNPLPSPSSSYQNQCYPPTPQPRQSIPHRGSTTGVQKLKESHVLPKKVLAETPSSPTTIHRGQIQEIQARGGLIVPKSVIGIPLATKATGNIGVKNMVSSCSTSSCPGSSKESNLQETPLVDVAIQHSSRFLLASESSHSTCRSLEPSSYAPVRERPPPSPSTPRRVVQGVQPSSGNLPGVSTYNQTGKDVPESPRFQKRNTGRNNVVVTRALRARSPSPVSNLRKDQPAGSAARQQGAVGTSQVGNSTLTSPQSQRKNFREPQATQSRGRERKNSISEISDNEDELLEYHRWQRDERIREQAMERLERQRLETILNLCAEYNKEDPPVSMEMPRVCQFTNTEEGSVQQTVPDPVGILSSHTHRLKESEDENLTEECSSTESQHQEHEDTSGLGQQELGYLIEERVRILARVDELKARVTELEQQLQESRQEAEMERALLQGERRAELDQVEAELSIISQLQLKLTEVDKIIQSEKEKGRANVSAERDVLARLRDGYSELKSQLHKCPESLREHLQEQLARKSEALELNSKRFEDLEFRQLEHESSLEEEKETLSRQLLQEKSEYQRSIAKRKEKMATLEIQASQLGIQAAQDCERMAKDRTLTLQMLQKEKERLAVLEKRYQSLTGAKGFPNSSSTMKEEVLHICEPDLLNDVPVKYLQPPASCIQNPATLLFSEYLRLSDVFKMYGSGCVLQATSPVPTTFCLSPPVSPDTPREEYVTVSQLNQIFGTPKADAPSPSIQSFQAIDAGPALSIPISQCDPDQSVFVEVCATLFNCFQSTL